MSRLLVASCLCLLVSDIASATNVVFSGNSGIGIEGSAIGAQSGGVISFDVNDLSTAYVPFDFPGNLDAVHFLDNGNFLLSYHSEVTIGGLTFDDDHIVEYDVESDRVTSFFNYAGIINSAPDSDIDAFFLLPNGNHVFSNVTDAVGGELAVSSNDLIEYNPEAGVASLYFDGDLIQDGDRFNNLSGASLFAEDVLAVSVSTGGTPEITLGGQGFQRDDIVLYDMKSGTGSMLVGDTLLATAVNAIHIGPTVGVPEPDSLSIVFLGLWLVARRRK